MDELLEGAESIDRRDELAILKHLGFKCRQTGSHHIWRHPEVPDTVTRGIIKSTERVWGYQIKDLRKAVEAVLLVTDPDRIPEPKEQETEEMPKTATMVKQMDNFVKEVSKPDESYTLITRWSVPDEVCELVYSYQKGELKNGELVSMLNESGYRTASGQLFTPPYPSQLAGFGAYVQWKQNREKEQKMMHVVTAKAEGTSSITGVPPLIQPSDLAPKFDANQALASLQAIINENDELKKRNAELEGQIQAIRALVCG